MSNYHEWGGTFIGLYLFSDILDIGARVAGEPQSGGTLFHDQQIATVGAEEIHPACRRQHPFNIRMRLYPRVRCKDLGSVDHGNILLPRSSYCKVRQSVPAPSFVAKETLQLVGR